MASASEMLQILGGGDQPQPAMSAASESPVSATQMRLDILSGKTTAPKIAPQAEGEQQIGAMEDVAKTIPSSIPKGLQMAAMFAPNLLNLAGAGTMWSGIKAHDIFADEPVSPETKEKLMKASQPFFSTPEETGAATVAGLYNTFSDNPLSREETDQIIHDNAKPLGGILHAPETTPGKYADTITQFIMGAKAFGARPRAGGSPPPTTSQQMQSAASKTADILQSPIQSVKNLPGAIGTSIKNNAPAILGGAASEAGGQVFEGTEAEIPARVIGAVVGSKAVPTISRAITATGERLGNIGIGPRKEMIPERAGAPAVNATYQQQLQAAQNVVERALDKEGLSANLDKGLAKKQVSQPTLAEVVDDQGIAQAQDAMRTRNPEIFQQRLAEQNSARTQMLSNVRGQGSIDDLGKFFSTQMQKADDYHQLLEDQATTRASAKGKAAGGYGNIPRQSQMTGDAVLDAQAWRKEGVNSAWNFLEPYKKAPADSSPILQATSRIIGEVNSLGGQKLLPVESEIYQNIASRWPSANIDFDTLKHLRTTIGEAQRVIGKDLGAESTPMRRLQILKNSVDEAVENTVNGITAAENKAVAAGAIAPESTLRARIDAEIQTYQAGLAEQMRSGTGEGAAAGTSRVGAVSEPPAVFSSAARAEGGEAMRPGTPARNQGVSSPIDQAAQELNSLRQLQTHLEDTIRQKTELAGKQGGIWRRRSITEAADDARNLDNVKKQVSAAETRLSQMKPQENAPVFGDEQRQQYESARGITFKHKTMSSLEKSGAVNPDGMLDPKKYDRWYAKNRNMLKSDEELSKNLKDWRKAQKELDETRLARKLDQQQFAKSRASAIINNDPVKEMSRIFSGKNPQKEFADLTRKIRGDRVALDGLKAAVGDHIINNVAKADLDEMGGRIRNQQAFRTFVAQNGKALKTIYGGQGVQNLEAVAADIRRTQLWNERAKIAGQSNTAKDALQAAKQGKLSILGKLTNEAAKHALAGGAVLGELSGGGAIRGALMGIPVKMASAFKAAGLDTIDKIQLEMMMNPEFARQMLKQLAADKIPVAVQGQIAASLMAPIAASIPEQRELMRITIRPSDALPDVNLPVVDGSNDIMILGDQP